MRLFIAVNFCAATKRRLSFAAEGLRLGLLRGSVSGTDNMHITLVFIGEAGESEEARIRRIVDGLDSPQFDIVLSGVGFFRREGGDICWMGVEKSPELEKAASYLASELKKSGFRIDSREFRPHVTLARRAVMKSSFDPAEFSEKTGAVKECVHRVSLMKSERINGRQVYTEIYGKELGI